MMTTRVYDLAEFQRHLVRAEREHLPVEVLRMPTSVPREAPDGSAEMRPAVMIDYALAFPDARYTFREVAVADPQGIVRLDTPL